MTEVADVAVIGSGLAARMAAIGAAEQTGSVALVSRPDPSPAFTTGSIDVLGYLPDGTGPIARPFERLDTLPSDHPYRIVGEDCLRDGLETFDSLVGSDLGGTRSDRNGLVLTQLGTPKPTFRYPVSFEAGMLSRRDDTLLVGFRGLPGIDGEFVASSLSRLDLSYEVRGTNVDIDLARFEHPRLRLAGALDRNERLGRDDRSIRTVLSESIAERHEGESRIGLPGVLGRKHTTDVLSRLEDDLGASVFEFLTDPPSITGSRLLDRLDRELDARGVERIGCGETIDYATTEGRITEIRNPTSSIRADQFVLATGGFLGGGIVERDGTFVESVFDLPVDIPREISEWTDPDPFETQPFARAGITVDERLRPIRGTGPIFSNLRACGGLLSGGDFTAEHSRSGVAIATGVEAGRDAGEAVR